MPLSWKTLALAFLLAGSGTAAVRSAIAGLDRDLAGPRSAVLVLGSVHLSNLPEDFDPGTLTPLLDRLAAFRPDVITIEGISGEGCDLMARHPEVYKAEEVGAYCLKTD